MKRLTLVLILVACSSAGFFAPAEDAGRNARMTLSKGCGIPGFGCGADEDGVLYTVGLTNGGLQKLYLRACGQSVAGREEVWERGAWQPVGPAVLCAQGPVPSPSSRGRGGHALFISSQASGATSSA